MLVFSLRNVAFLAATVLAALAVAVLAALAVSGSCGGRSRHSKHVA